GINEELIGSERFLKLSSLLVSLSLEVTGNSTDNVGIIASARSNACNIVNSSLSSATPRSTVLYHHNNAS
ncbi:17731_t:CDS:1, partial [Gigaspora rosea]